VADLALIAMAFVWGAMFTLSKRALEDISPLFYLSLRFSFATAALSVWYWRRGGGKFTGVQWGAGVSAGAALMAGFILQTLGLRLTTPAKSAFLTASYIVLVPFLAAFVYKSVPRRAECAGALIAGAGMALLGLEGEQLALGRGELLTAGCAAAFAAHIVLLGHFAPRLGYEALSVLQVGGAAAVAVAATPLLETVRVVWSGPVVWAIAGGGLLATALAFVLQTWAQQRISPTRAAVLFSLEPVFAWMVSWVAEGEVLTPRAAAGAALILCGVLAVEMKPAGAREHP
jgi:drug/metabolite transporter (DMT)-like permease